MRPEHPRPSATEASHIEASERAWQALARRKRGQSYRAIAKGLGVSLATAHGYVAQALAALREQTLQSAADLRELELARLDDLEHRLRSRLGADCSDADCAKIAGVVVRIAESRRKLLGIDAPQKVEMSGNLYTVLDASPDCPAWQSPGTEFQSVRV